MLINQSKMQRIIFLILAVLLYNSGSAQNGAPDPSFGNNGFISTKSSANYHSFPQIVKEGILHPDGKISLVIGDGSKTRISKRLYNGLPDLGFGINGSSVVVSLVLSSAALQPDGKIVVAGTTNGTSDFMLARYNTNGTLDQSFGNAGVVISDIGSAVDYLNAVVITTDGKIIAGGSSRVNGIDQFTLVYFTPSGIRDNSVGNNGVITTDFDGQYSGIAALTVQPDGKIVAAGTVGSPSGSDFGLARYNADGTPDLSFHSNGRTSSDFAPLDRVTSVILDNKGKIYVGGISLEPNYQRRFRIAKYNADGLPDLTYNKGTGTVLGSFGNSDDILTHIRLMNDGSVIAAGQSDLNGVSRDVALLHINADGTTDPNFGNNGLVLADYKNLDDESDFLLIQPDGKILAGGMSVNFSNFNDSWFSCFRFNADGTSDKGFGNAGIMVDFFGVSNYTYSAMFLQPDGKLTAVSESSQDTVLKWYLSRFNANGTPDNSFSPNGRKELTYEYGTSFFQPDGKMLRLSYSQTNSGDFMLIRYNTDGTPDKGFGTGGKVISDFGGTESTGALAFQADGKIIVGGFSRNANGTDWLIVRYNANGSIDGSFGKNGIVRKDNAIEENIQSISIGADGKIVLGGTSFVYPPDFSYIHFDLLIARLNPDGSFDAGFGNKGVVVIDRSNNDYLGALAIQDDSKIVFSYYYSDDGNSTQQTFLERLNIDGTPDTGFGITGKAATDGVALTLLADQKLLVSGNVLNNRNNYDFRLNLFTRDGQPDMSFGNNGKITASFTGLDNTLYNNLVSGNALFFSGKGIDSTGTNLGLIAKFLLRPAALNCPANQSVATDKNTCSAKVYNINPAFECTSTTTIRYKLSGATTGTGECTASGRRFNKGITTVTYSIGSAQSCAFTVTVTDKEIPVIERLSTSPSSLWPADHKMKDITVNYTANDNCGIKNNHLSVSSNEPVNSNGTNQEPDWQIIDDHHIRLRAGRLESGSGRIYTIKLTTTDNDGNKNTKDVVVTVPKKPTPECRMDVDIAPNPSHNYFMVTLRSTCSEPINMKIFNLTGSLISSFDNFHAPRAVKIGEGLVRGIYYLKVTQADFTKTLKLIKE